MGKKMLLWFISGASLVIALGALCDEFGILDPFRGMAIVFVLLMVVTRLIFDDAYRAASYQRAFFFYVVNAVASAVLFISVLFILNTFAPKLSALEREQNPDNSLFQQYQDRLANLRGESTSLESRLQREMDDVNAKNDELIEQNELLQADLEIRKEQIKKLSSDISWHDTYVNEEWGFQVTLTGPWENYQVKKRESDNQWGGAMFEFQVPIQDKVYKNGDGHAAPLMIVIYPRKEWGALEKDENAGPHGTFIAKYEEYVFTSSGWQDAPPELMYVDFQIPKITSSFKLIEQGGE